MKSKLVLWLSVVMVLAAFAGGCAKKPLPLPPDVASAGGEGASDGSQRDAALKDSGLGGSGSGSGGDSSGLGGSGSGSGSMKEEGLNSGASGMGSGSDKSADAGKDGGVVPGKEGMTDFGSSGQGGAGQGGAGQGGAGQGGAGQGGAGQGESGDVARMLPFEATSDLQDIFFKFDKSDLDDTSKNALKKNVQWLKEHANVRAEIQGHCDERGTNNYNLGLGERRALSVKKYLMALGIDKDRLFTISYGEERPFCRESNEECWTQNRRAHFMIAR